MENKNVSRPSIGLNTDSSPTDQPKGTYRYAKNSVLESVEGDIGFLSNELGSEVCALFPVGYVPIGKTYMSGGEVAIFLAKLDGTLSEIGILTKNCVYTTHVNFDLGFKVNKQIDATFRLRRGCERTVYFTDDHNKPRIYNFDKPEDFQTASVWDVDKFSLFKTYNTFPEFSNFMIQERGSLPAGSYNFSIQYLDDDLNATEFISTTDTIIIYNDSASSKSFKNVEGSTNLQTFYQDFGLTNKSIKFDIANLDSDFPYYRIGIIESNTGNGEISRVIYSSIISTQTTTYTYTGTNGEQLGTEAEIASFNNIIERARHIEQIENRLVLADVQGKQINYCRLQKYASKIKAQLVTEEVVLNDLGSINNQKRGTVHVEKLGYMPGEIYSFGIVWIFEGGTVSPVYHIPGRSSTYLSDMSTDNALENTNYIANDMCSGEDYWGYDSQGDPLTGEPVRHHRFPLRSEVNKPLIVKDGTSTELITYYLYVDISGTVNTVNVPTSPLVYTVNYLDNGVPTTKDLNLSFDPANPDVDITRILVTTSLNPLTYVDVDEGGLDPSLNSELVYVGYEEEILTNLEDAVYTSEIFGIEFSNIDVPTVEETGGEEVIGYYIVRNERGDDAKTILDTGVITPLLLEDDVNKFASHGHVMPQSDLLQEDTFGLIHPEHRFRQKEYTDTTEFIQEGEYVLQSSNTSSEIVQDVMPGTSYDASVNKRRERDSDGFDLHVFTRHNNLEYARIEDSFAVEAEIEEVFYLDSLFAKTITDTTATRKDIYNLSGDNKIGIVQLNITKDIADFRTKLPFVVMKRSLSDPYSNFRVAPYYNEVSSPIYFSGATGNSVEIFNGDSYIAPMKYLSSTFYDIRIKNRRTKKGVWNVILGVLAVVAGTAITVLSAGTLAAAGVVVAGFGVTQLATGFKKGQAARVYQDLYEQGLKNTVNDEDTEIEFSPNPDDDEIQWFTDVLSNLWFETGVNVNWRMGNTVGLTDFLPSPEGYDEAALNSYAIEKVTNVDPEADGGRTYQGYAKAEIYEVNPDYDRRDKEKTFGHLALEYDCCSDCLEDFPHRSHYSEQSFQEELTDNYRTFLPLNYRDIEGETGEINNIFRIQNNLYLHTEEALWHLPQNIQERATGDIISFIGTGDFFSIPPRKILDDETGNSAGTQHKWGTIKTPSGVFFVAENQNTVYRFDGNKLDPISNVGEFSWFKNNTTIKFDESYYDSNTKVYPYRDNPSNEYGTGFILSYDSRYERILLTKKDYIFTPGTISTDDYELCYSNGNVTVFEDVSATIATEEGLGWTYTGITDCELCFERQTTETIDIEVMQTLPNTADIHVFFDTSGSFGGGSGTTVAQIESGAAGPCLLAISEAIDDWVVTYAAANPDWSGTLYKYTDSTERWVNYAQIISSTTYFGLDLSTKDIIVVSFCNESANIYHDSSLDSPIIAPTTQYLTDYANFLTLHSQYNSFLGIAYPIVFGTSAGSCGGGAGGSLPSSKNMLLHSIAALYGTELTPTQIASDLSTINPGFTPGEWATMLTDLQTANPYPDDGLNNYGWVGKWDRYADATGNVIDSVQFQLDIEELIAGVVTSEVQQVVVPVTEYQCLPGTLLIEPETYDCSWTKSFNMKFNGWTAYHDYTPDFYINTPDRFYAWEHGTVGIWKHNVETLYQNYFGIRGDFIIEYVSLSSPLETRVWDNLKLITQASTYDAVTESYVDKRFVTFNEAMIYNSRQNSGVLSLVAKDTQANPENYMLQQLSEASGQALIDRNERDWTINDFRDMIGDYTVPMFLKDKVSVQGVGYTDKILNPSAINLTKDWTQQEVFRDKYLIIRLIFNTFEDTKLVLNYSVENEILSHR